MNRYEFEDRISDYLDNHLNVSERQAFEKYAKENKDAEDLLNSVKNTIELIKTQKSIKTSENFIPKLTERIKTYKNKPINSTRQKAKSLIFGFSPKNSALMGVFIFSFFLLLVNIVPSANSFFQSNIVSSKKNAIEKTIPGSNAGIDKEIELVSADSSKKIIDSKEKINIKDKINLVKNKR